MKILLSSIICVLFVQFAQGQKRQNVYFFTNDGKETQIKAKADFVRIIEAPDSGDTRFKLTEYFKNDVKKTQGYLKSFQPSLVYDGLILQFDSTGAKVQDMTYNNGLPFGISTTYYSNGKVKRKNDYIAPVKAPQNQMIGTDAESFFLMNEGNVKVMYDADSNGVVNVENGNGHVKEVEGLGDAELVQEGSYINGFKNGTWTGKFSKSDNSFIEIYDSSRLVSGESIKDGIKYPYTIAMQAPEYPGGENAWNSYIGRSVRYPADAQKNVIQGKVSANFVIDNKGNITDIHIYKRVYPSIDDEATRVLENSKKWIPGKQRGIPVKVRYTQSISFNL
ncbi:TonB family protein [Pedobacter sp. UYP30]|uniref:energy transducer TonB n=1 Tax=Pedobacter sp. UYP30 TaxID=1756400 RepID=UPI00339AEE1C